MLEGGDGQVAFGSQAGDLGLPSNRNRRSPRPDAVRLAWAKLPPLPLQPMKARRLPLCSMSSGLASFLQVRTTAVIQPAALTVQLQGVAAWPRLPQS